MAEAAAAAVARAGASPDAASLPYHEPSITQILVLSSFLVALNAINSILDRTLYCGLVGQVLVGIAWGTPGAQWLASTLSPSLSSSSSYSTAATIETAVVQLGYLGLILLVYEGGVSTSIASLKANLTLAAGVAATGIAAPMALSFLLASLTGANALQCFAAGAALCSTSLGTTFTVLSTSGLSATRLGSVLSTAAMMDDVVGLVMVQIVASLGDDGRQSSSSIAAVTVLRPVLVSLVFAVTIPLVNRFVLRPAMRFLDDAEGKQYQRQQKKQQEEEDPGNDNSKAVLGILDTKEAAFVIHSALLMGLVAAAAYAGASVLLAAYLTGIIVCWWDAERETRQQQKIGSAGEISSGRDGRHEDTPTAADAGTSGRTSTATSRRSGHTGIAIYEHCYASAVNRILKPFFFASIGFSIPITKMFSGAIVWRGLIYTILMLLGKVLCGAWLVRLPGSGSSSSSSHVSGRKSLVSMFRDAASFFPDRFCRIASAIISSRKRGGSKITAATTRNPPAQPGRNPVSGSDANTRHTTGVDSSDRYSITLSPVSVPGSNETAQPTQEEQHPPTTTSSSSRSTTTTPPSSTETTPPKPVSLYPAGIMSFAMVARGEIGFLISAVAESKGIFRSPATSDSPSSSSSSSISPPQRRTQDQQEEPSQIFLIVTWAIVLCTIIGPLVVGVLVKRVKRLEAQRRQGKILVRIGEGRGGGGGGLGGEAGEAGGQRLVDADHHGVSNGGGSHDHAESSNAREQDRESRHEDHVLGVWGV